MADCIFIQDLEKSRTISTHPLVCQGGHTLVLTIVIQCEIVGLISCIFYIHFKVCGPRGTGVHLIFLNFQNPESLAAFFVSSDDKSRFSCQIG